MGCSFEYIGLSVANLEIQRRFYSEALGLSEQVAHLEWPEQKLRTAILRSQSGLQIELIEREGSSSRSAVDAYDAAGTQGYTHWALNVEDIQTTFDKLIQAGAIEVSSPAKATRPGTYFAYLKDPEGNLLELIQTKNSIEANNFLTEGN